MAGQPSSARGPVIRDAVIFTPSFLALAAAWATAFIKEGSGAIPLLVILGTVALLVGFQSLQALRDLASRPEVAKGEISRKWKRADLLFFQGHYVYVNKRVFKIAPLEYEQIEEGDTVSITHYPHTNTVVSIQKEGGRGRAS